MPVPSLEYRDEQWLYKKYVMDKLSTTQIGILCGVSHATISRRLKKYTIATRSKGEGLHIRRANHCNLSQEATEWINGELLGDGCIYSRSPYSAWFTYTSKYPEYIKYVSDTLKSFGIKQTGKTYKEHCKKFDSYGYHYNSNTYEELLPIYKQWYPSGEKIIPKNIRLTPLTVRQWYIGDGSLIHDKERSSHIMLCSDSFPISCIDWIMKQLYNLKIKATRQPSSNRIHISSYSTERFLDYIGKCPINCYNYKFEY